MSKVHVHLHVHVIVIIYYIVHVHLIVIIYYIVHVHLILIILEQVVKYSSIIAIIIIHVHVISSFHLIKIVSGVNVITHDTSILRVWLTKLYEWLATLST